MEVLRFQVIDRLKRVYLPWNLPRKTANQVDIITTPEQMSIILEEGDARVLADHLAYPLRHYVIAAHNEYSYIVMKRCLFPGVVAFGWVPWKKLQLVWHSGVEVLYLTNPQLAARVWGTFLRKVFRRERVLGVVAAERFLQADFAPGAQFEHRSYLLARGPVEEMIDSLYSELVLLPVRDGAGQ
jgi:hypothetical protein